MADEFFFFSLAGDSWNWTLPDAAGDLAQSLGVSREVACKIIAYGSIHGHIMGDAMLAVRPIWRKPK